MIAGFELNALPRSGVEPSLKMRRLVEKYENVKNKLICLSFTNLFYSLKILRFCVYINISVLYNTNNKTEKKCYNFKPLICLPFDFEF